MFADMSLALDLDRYFLSLEILPYHGILRADAAIHLRSRGLELDKVVMVLNRGLSVTASSCSHEIASINQRLVEFRDLKGLTVNLIELKLNKPLKPGGELGVNLSYEGGISSYEEIFPYVRDRIGEDYSIIRPDAFSYPVPVPPVFRKLVSYLPRQRFTYRLEVEVPREYTVANPGKLLEAREMGGWRRYIYESKLPSWRIDISISRFTTIDEGDLQLYVFPEDRRYGVKMLKEVRRCLDLYRGLIGPPPKWFGYTIIELPEGWGGQADVAGALLPRGAFRDPHGANAIYHELAHLWNPPSAEEVPSRFLDEGFASYLQLVAEEAFLGANIDKRLDEAKKRLVGMIDENPELLETPLSEYGERQLTDASYLVGPWLLHMLRRSVGDDCFWRALKRFLRDQEASATLKSFRDIFSETCGREAGDLLDKWLFTSSLIKLIVQNSR